MAQALPAVRHLHPLSRENGKRLSIKANRLVPRNRVRKGYFLTHDGAYRELGMNYPTPIRVSSFNTSRRTYVTDDSFALACFGIRTLKTITRKVVFSASRRLITQVFCVVNSCSSRFPSGKLLCLPSTASNLAEVATLRRSG